MKGEDIEARLVALGVAVVEIVAGLPEIQARKHVAGQLLRSSTYPGPTMRKLAVRKVGGTFFTSLESR